jgi:hypothetical protein
MVANNIGISAFRQQFFSGARPSLGPIERKNLSLHVLAKTDPVAQLAREYQVSRKFLYTQAAKARHPICDTSVTPWARVLKNFEVNPFTQNSTNKIYLLVNKELTI